MFVAVERGPDNGIPGMRPTWGWVLKASDGVKVNDDEKTHGSWLGISVVWYESPDAALDAAITIFPKLKLFNQRGKEV